MLHKPLIILLIFLCLQNITTAQTKIVFQNFEFKEIIVSYSLVPDKNESITNYFIAEIARSIQKKTEFTKYTITFKRIERIAETEPGFFSASFELTDVSCTGDIFYKTFNIADVLIPTHCSFQFNVYANQIKPLTQIVRDSSLLGTGYNKLAFFNFNDTSGTSKFTAYADSLTFFYNNTSQQRFASKLKLIDEYFLSEAIIDNCYKQINTYDFYNTDMIIVYDINLKELEKTIEDLYNKDFAGKLKLVNHDPVNFIDRFNKLSDTINNIRQTLNYKIENLDRLYYERGIEELKKENVQNAELMFHRSILFNQQYTPSQLELVKLLMHKDSLFEAANKMSFILQHLNPEPELHKKVLLYADTVYNMMLSAGNDFIKDQKYNEAIESFEQCVKFCLNSGNYNCSGSHIKGLAMARFGIYQSYLSVSQKAIDKGKLELAEAYIKDALKYQKTYSEHIINNAEAISKIEKLILAYIASGDTLNNKRRYEKAMQNFKKAQLLSEEYNLSLPQNFDNSLTKAHQGVYKNLIQKSRQQLNSELTEAAEKTLLEAIAYQKQNSGIIKYSEICDSLMSSIRLIQYNSNLNKGKQYLNIYDYKTALGYFDKAKNIENEYNFSLKTKLDSLRILCATIVFSKRISGIQYILNDYNTDSVFKAVNDIEQQIAFYRLEKDTVIKNSFDKLRKKTQIKRCNLAKNKYDSLFIQANKAIALQDYILAGDLFTKAINLAEVYPECNIDIENAINEKKNYLFQANYQQMIRNAEVSLNSNNYKSFLNQYSEAENFCYNMQLQNAGIIHQTLTDKLYASSDTALIISAVDFYLQKNQAEKSLQCLKCLKNLNYPPSKTRGLQQQIAVILAMKDYAANTNNIKLKPSVYVISYTAGDKWFTVFKNIYITTWKSLK